MLQGAKDVCLAAADDVTRQRCLRIIEAASSSWVSPPDIAASVALTRGLLDMKSLAAVKAVLAALGIPLDHPSLKAVGFDSSSLVAEMKRVGVTATQFKDAGWSAANLVGHAFSKSELQAAGFNVAELYTIVFVDSNPATLARAQLYYRDVEFASQLCSKFADAERSDAELYSRLSQAHDALQLIVDHNPLLRSPPSERQPAWPRHEALLRFDLPLFVWKHNLLFKNEWASRFVVLRGSRLYYSNGKSGHPDSLEGSLAFMRSNPAPDGHYCVDLHGMRALLLPLATPCVTLLRRLQRCAVQRSG
jgi:hypothetical protein